MVLKKVVRSLASFTGLLGFASQILVNSLAISKADCLLLSSESTRQSDRILRFSKSYLNRCFCSVLLDFLGTKTPSVEFVVMLLSFSPRGNFIPSGGVA